MKEIRKIEIHVELDVSAPDVQGQYGDMLAEIEKVMHKYRRVGVIATVV